MAPTRRKIGGKKNKNTIKYTWGIHSLTRKRMKTHTKKKKGSTKKRNSQRRRRKRGRKRKGGSPAEDQSTPSVNTQSSTLDAVRREARERHEREAAARVQETLARRRNTPATTAPPAETSSPTTPRWLCTGCVRVSNE
jgi:hypothetical protein